MNLSHLQKIYYVPGLFSAIVIPLVFWYYISQRLNEPKPNIIDLGIPAKYDPNIPMKNQKGSFEPLRNWNYKQIIVQPNTAKQNSKNYVAEIKKMQQRNKKETGIEFILDDHNSYGDFVSILNDMHISKQDVYGVDVDKTGHIFAITEYKDPNEEPSYFGNDLVAIIDNGSIADKMTWSDQLYFKIKRFCNDFQNDLLKLPTNIFYIIFGFLIFLNISVFEISRKSI